MASTAQSRQLSAYATEYGTFIGLAWIVVFALFICGLRSWAALPLFLGTLLFICLPVLPCYFAWRWRKRSGETAVGYGRAFFFCLLMMMYTCLLTAAVEFVYFRWMDHGAVTASLETFICSPELRAAYQQLGMSQQLDQLDEALTQLKSWSVSDLVVSLLNQNIFISIINCILAAFFGMKKVKNEE